MDDREIEELLTKAEWDIYQASLPGHAKKLSDTKLRKEIDRARQARDKARDLYRRQSVSSTAKRRSRGAALVMNERTGRKAEVLADALSRLEEDLAAREAPAGQAAPGDRATPAVSHPNPEPPPSEPRQNRAARRAAASERGDIPRYMSDAAQAAARRGSTLGGPTAKHIDAARAAAGRRFQAKKDGR